MEERQYFKDSLVCDLLEVLRGSSRRNDREYLQNCSKDIFSRSSKPSLNNNSQSSSWVASEFFPKASRKSSQFRYPLLFYELNIYFRKYIIKSGKGKLQLMYTQNTFPIQISDEEFTMFNLPIFI